MRRMAVLIIVLLMFLANIPVSADGLSIESDEEDKVGVLGDVTVDRQISGNAVNIFGNMRIEQTVGGDAVTIIGDADIGAVIAGEIVTILGRTELAHRAGAGGDVVTVFGGADIRGDVKGDLVVVLGDATIDAKVSGQVVCILGNLKLTENAVVGGNVFSLGGFEKAQGALVGGHEEIVIGAGINSGFLLLAAAFMTIAFSLIVLVFGMVLLIIMRDRLKLVSRVPCQDIGILLLKGLLMFMGISIASVILSITIIVPLLYLFVLLLSATAAGIYAGKLLFRALGVSSNLFAELFTGIFTITLVRIALILIIPHESLMVSGLLYIGCEMLVNSAGLGLLLQTRRRKSDETA